MITAYERDGWVEQRPDERFHLAAAGAPIWLFVYDASLARRHLRLDLHHSLDALPQPSVVQLNGWVFIVISLVR